MRIRRLSVRYARGALCLLVALSLGILGVIATSRVELARRKIKQITIPSSIVVQVLNHPKLQQFLHPEAPGRVPVVISAHLVDPRLSLRKFGKPVRIIPDSRLKNGDGAFLRFDNYSVKQNIAMVGIRYKAEGVGGDFRFRRSNDGSWKLIKAEVWET